MHTYTHTHTHTDRQKHNNKKEVITKVITKVNSTCFDTDPWVCPTPRSKTETEQRRILPPSVPQTVMLKRPKVMLKSRVFFDLRTSHTHAHVHTHTHTHTDRDNIICTQADDYKHTNT